MAAALALLVVLPLFASNGTLFKVSGGHQVTLSVFANNTGLNTALDAGAEGADPEDTKLGNTLYASNDTAAFNQVMVQVINVTAGAATTATITVDVDSDAGQELSTGGGKLDLLQAVVPNGTLYQGVFFILDFATTSIDSILANDGDKITITSKEGAITVAVTMTVDGKGPVITATLPDHKTLTTKTKATFGATITDAASGMRPDTEGGGDTDGDGVTTEPLTDGTGASVDIELNLGFATKDDASGNDTNESAQLNAAWTEITKDHSYSFGGAAAEITGLDNFDTAAGDIFWNIVATDRAGNTTTTDVDDEKADDDNFKITIDDEDPKISTAQTGIGFDEDDREEETDSNVIKLVFVNETSLLPDELDTDTIQPGDFVVENNTVTAIIHPDEDDGTDKDLAGNGFDTTNVVYLILANELAPDEEPEVQMLGGALSDIAGNSNDVQAIDADDNIAPTLTVTITGLDDDGDPNNVDGRMITADEFVVRVESNEELEEAPRVFFALIEFKIGDESKQQIEQVSPAAGDSISTDGTNAWEEIYDGGDVPGHAHSGLGSGTQTLFAVIVTARDASSQNNNAASAGWDVADDGLVVENDEDINLPKVQKAGLLGELDDDISVVNTGELIPNTGDVDKTESRNPFISLRFTESNEFRVQDATGSDDQAKLTDGDDSIDIDSHNTVTITSITLDGEDVSGQLLRAEKDEFSLALINLAEGEYELLYTAVDDAGNEIEDVSFEFEVVERSEYELSLRPGWNLISLPGTPVDPSIDAVLPDSMKASTILSWRDGAFEVNERQSDGTWDPSGGVTEIVAGLGYWVLTTAFEDIETLIPERSPATILPTVAIVGGWNLIGVVDLAQGDAGTDLDGDADDYFSSIEQKVVYGFDTQTSTFTKVKGTDKVVLGKGYWVWADKAGTLVP